MITFNELPLSPPILQAISELGFVNPSPIQEKALPLLLGESTDFLGLAATGTGKTAAFSIPLLERIKPEVLAVQALILCPTRELAVQVAGQIQLLGKHKKIKALSVYGGTGYGDQLRGLRNGAHVVVGTPGRVIDHLEKGSLRLDQVHTLVLDEADEMISMGFVDDIEAVLSQIPRESSNIWLFSATMSPEVRRVAETYLQEPERVQINAQEMLSSTVEQIYYVTHESNKPEVLCKLIDAADDFFGLVFFQTKALVVDITQYLKSRGYAVDCLHGDMDQPARDRAMKAFRERRTKVLLCTDVASRGLDVKDVTHVVNYSIPRELDNYVHRIGRTARSGKSGLAMSLVTGSHRPLIARIERLTKSKMREGKIPTRKEIGAKKVAQVLAKFQEQDHARAAEIMGGEWKTAIAAMTPDEIAGRFLTLMYPEIFTAPAPVAAPPSPIRPAGASIAPVAGKGEIIRTAVVIQPRDPGKKHVIAARSDDGGPRGGYKPFTRKTRGPFRPDGPRRPR